MKKVTIFYWIITGLFLAFMLFSSIPDIIVTHEAQAFMENTLHYPGYITPFLGIAKLLGIIAILIPGFPRIKEWAYAGLAFDLLGATYSIISVSGKHAAGGVVFMIIVLAFLAASYTLYHKKMKGSAGSANALMA